MRKKIRCGSAKMEKSEKNCNKILGYLEKKGKMSVMSMYKKYWFVLEGGLLLYYRSKDDYETISPCKGSINLGPPCIVKPCSSLTGVFQIQTRTATVTLRAESRDDQNRWMQAIMSEINPQKTLQRMSHFRYSMENVQQKETNPDTTPESHSSHNSTEDIIQRLQKMGAQSYDPLGLTLRHKDRKSEEKLSQRDSKSSEHIYERISAELRECLMNEHVRYIEEKSMTLPMKGFGATRTKREENRPKTLMLENETYAVSARKKETSEKPKKLKHRKSFFTRKPKEEYFIVENDTYATTDHNENTVRKVGAEEEEDEEENPCYSNREGLYEEIEKPQAEYAEPSSFQEEVDALEEKDRKKSKMKKKKSDEIPKLKKKRSFIGRVWRRKEKKEKTEETKATEEKEDLYETVPDAVLEKVCLTDSTAVQMLSELQNILEHKMPILIERISSNLNSPNELNQPEEPEPVRNENNPLKDVPHKIPDPPAWPTKTPEIETCQDDAPNKPVALPPKKKQSEKVKTLDEILSELETQKSNSKNKVKKLIKRFSEAELSENDVVLRTCRKNYVNKEDSDELGRLLEELAKVTNAPILTPGVTSSLNGASMPDEELSKLLPVKQRRFSEPDYDIPRPHKSLTIAHRRDDIPENVIGSTRFFGPILKPSDMVLVNDGNSSQLNSITPDSLENTVRSATPETENHHYYKFMDKETFYMTIGDARQNSENVMVDNEIYAEPRSIQKCNLTANRNGDYDENDEVFVDSLEVCRNEVSTEF